MENILSGRAVPSISMIVEATRRSPFNPEQDLVLTTLKRQ